MYFRKAPFWEPFLFPQTDSMTLHRYIFSACNEKLTKKDSKIVLAQFVTNLGTIIYTQKIKKYGIIN